MPFSQCFVFSPHFIPDPQSTFYTDCFKFHPSRAKSGLPVIRFTQKQKALELGGIELHRSSYFFKGEGGHVDHLRDHPDVEPAVALWLTRSHVELFCNFLSRFEVFYLFKPNTQGNLIIGGR